MDGTEVFSPDWSVTKTEEFDVDFAKQLVEDKCLPKDERDKLRKYYRNREQGNKHQTTYKLGRHLKHENLGRLCALRGESLQGLSRDVRAALAGPYYWDVDFVNAQPTLLAQYAEKHGWKCDKTKAYTERREELLSEVCEALNCERWFAKEKVIQLFFGGSADGMPRFFVEELHPELRMIMRNVWEQNKTRLKFLEKQPNHIGKALADVLQTEERGCLLALDRALSRRGRSMDVYIHDGGLVRKKDKETAFPTGLLRELEADVEREVGYKLALAVKPLKTSFVKKVEEDDYPDKKTQWEETGWKDGVFFKLRNPPAFIGIYKDSVRQFSRSELIQNEEDNTLSDGSSFIKRWLEDPEKKEYNEVVFMPTSEQLGSGVFNLFRGFHAKPKASDKFRVYQELLKLLVNHDEASFEYVENWLAHAVQRPNKKTGVVLVFKGKKGVGKDTFWDAFGYNILGKYYTATSKPEHDLFGRFGGATAQKLLVKIEEGNFLVNKEHEERFKGLITCKKDVMEQKGKEPIEVDSFTNYVMTTNQNVPVVLTSDERRFVLFEASEEKKGDEDYWTDVYAQLEDEEVHSAYLDYLMKKDISEFNPRAKLLRTEAFMDALQSFIPYHARWFQSHIETNESEDDVEFTWKARDLYGYMRQSQYVKFELTETKFGWDMRDYIKAGIVTKVKMGQHNSYSVSRNLLQKFLQDKSWWVEL